MKKETRGRKKNKIPSVKMSLCIPGKIHDKLIDEQNEFKKTHGPGSNKKITQIIVDRLNRSFSEI